jgi:RNA polymerase sigma factor (sigma-70 family)
MSSIEKHVKDLKAGIDAREALYNETLPLVLPYLERWIPAALRPKWEPMDLFHEAFLRAVEGLRRIECADEASWRNYVLTIAHNAIRDALRRKSRLGVRLADHGSEGGIPASAVADAQPRPSELASREETVERALEHLSESDAVLVRLKVVECLSTEEIAARLGKGFEATRKAVYRALGRLREVGRELWPPPEA